MRPYIQLNRGEWRQLHNAVCEAEREASQLFSVLKDGGRARDAIDAIRVALRPAYDQDSEAFERQMDYFRETQKANGFRAIWSLYDETDEGSFADAHPYAGAQSVVYDQHWGPDAIRISIAGPTWLDLYRAADAAIRESKDEHHIYIEAFEFVSDTQCLRLTTGS